MERRTVVVVTIHTTPQQTPRTLTRANVLPRVSRIAGGPAPAPVRTSAPGRLSTLGLVTVLLGAFLPMLDFFIVNVALPTIDKDLSAGPATLELFVAGYGIAYAVLLVLGGRLGDLYGRKKLFVAGALLFGLTSAACGFAPTALALVVARVAQGASAALMLPQALATIQAATEGERRAKAMGVYGAVGGIAVVIGQVLGGVLLSANLFGTGWRFIFLVNVPVAVVAVLLALRTVPETRSANPARVDVPGTVLLAGALLALLVPLMEGRSLGWPVWTWVLLALFPFLLTAFVLVERRGERNGQVPLVPISLLKLRGLKVGLTMAVPFFAGFGGFMMVMAVALQVGLHEGPIASGFAMVPMAAGFFAASLAGPRLLARFGSKVIVTGAVIQALGLGTLALTVANDWSGINTWGLLPGMVIAGTGQGLVMPPLIRLVLSQIPVERAGVGGGILATTQQSSLALGVATLGTLFLSLSPSMGMRDALTLVLVLQFAATFLVIALSTRLPRKVG
ncbi:MFS transporter [Streptacidiphilus pinicola]|uniref:MFS transporter n=1 Tax=Streptacidiphilus pinicola TaxID=2219663 RepID=A0A2X0KH22_9ACTN|nr:MFS transporter [Streptacidiphilus pinicola]RAG86080.1 MFS transporter [Streptacidiphilus pinicola]